LSGGEAASPSSSTAKAIPSAAIRKTGTTTTARPKANILGAKKKGLGAKKVVAADGLDFEAAEKKAKEEAERIEKLGYNPDEEQAEIAAAEKAKSPTTEIVSPTPVSPSKGGYGSGKGRERSDSEMERLGMGMGRLGFGQMASNKPAAQPKKMGFGATSRGAEGKKWRSFFFFFFNVLY
jgi:ADP-ribosylation factor GTPase-activating protein 2/3